MPYLSLSIVYKGFNCLCFGNWIADIY